MIAATEIPLELCYEPAAARAIDPATVKVLAASIAEIGLLNPISVRRAIKVRAGRDADAFEVLAGMHRVKAFRKLGRETIPAIILDADDLRAALFTIDENLCRKDLTPAERAAQIAKRKRIYEALYPEAAVGAGTGGRNGRTKDDLAKLAKSNDEAEGANRFTAATAELTGHSERSVRREARRGNELGEDALARVARTSLDKGDELDALAKLPEADRTAIIDRAAAGEKVSAKTALKQSQRRCREEVLGARQAALPAKRYGVILADPEWRFEPRSRTSGLQRSADNHYPTSATETIAARPVASIAADDCALFLWATAPMLPQALQVMAAWGFAYKTHIIWRKAEKHIAGLVLGTGYWFRNGHELLLVGTHGDLPAPAPGAQWPSMFDAPPRRHSEKPDQQYELIEAYFPTLPKIELNARRARPGWDAWGFEAPGIALSGFPAGYAITLGVSQSGGLASAGNGQPLPEAAGPAPEREVPAQEARSAERATANETESWLRTPPDEKPAEQERARRASPKTVPLAVGEAPTNSADDLDVPPSLRRVELTADERALLDQLANDPATLELNARIFVTRMRDGARPTTETDRRYLKTLAAEAGLEAA